MKEKNRFEKPTVIVTGPEKRLRFGWWATRFMLFLAGLRGIYITPKSKHLPQEADGIIIGGGDDIDPEHYGVSGDAGATYDAARDKLEMTMVRVALRCRVPILGICRGAQLINVVLGGSLFTDIRPQRKNTPNRNTLFPIKWAALQDGSKLARILNRNPIKINSLHNQAIDKVASPLHAVAKDSDGFIQAVESKSSDFIIGVQWHPEYLPLSQPQRQLFAAFAKAVAENTHVLRRSSSAQAA